ncbi:hypothetical protein A3A56_01365 [Candidatus Roizmanbacteria bacterium RIFCSPLOWO2_01_FULL_40_32]|nr:MAG: hypothetical protein A3A56_01365 [Candidatus Roizmanbacteria bacterium RIFCSPLOWO2_01_FULL_40_32]
MAVFGTTSPDNSPHLSSMFFVANEDLNFYFITKSETAKVANIAANSKVSVVVSDQDSYKTVEANGIAIAISGFEKIRTIIQMFTKIYVKEEVIEHGKLFNWPPPIEKIEKGDIMVYELKPSYLRYADYSNSSPLEGNFVQEIIVNP